MNKKIILITILMSLISGYYLSVNRNILILALYSLFIIISYIIDIFFIDNNNNFIINNINYVSDQNIFKKINVHTKLKFIMYYLIYFLIFIKFYFYKGLNIDYIDHGILIVGNYLIINSFFINPYLFNSDKTKKIIKLFDKEIEK